MNEFVEMIGASIILLAIFGGIASPLIALIIGLFYYLKKRLEHTQVMAAIEKGADLSQLRPVGKPQKSGPLWIKNLTSGIAMLIISIGFLLLTGPITEHRSAFTSVDAGTVATPWVLLCVILFAIGISRLIRGLLQRKAQRQNGNGSNDTVEPVSLSDET
jgi:hypothetical protein